jgi:glycerate kinase
MKIVIAMAPFKGTLDANQACEIVANAVAECVPSVQLVIKPMADGGRGTARAMLEAAGGRWIPKKVTGPLADMQVEAGFAWFEKDRTALVEMALASGLQLLPKGQTNPLKTTTYGTGQLVDAAIKYGARKILLAVGDSATVDGGVGAAMALGFVFLDQHDEPILLGGAGLEYIAKIIKPENFSIPPVEVLCDVDNPLCGEHGSAKVYGPQKGATADMIERLDKGLLHLASVVRKQLQRDINNVPGAGAAGGLAGGALAFMNATLVSGIETVMERSNLRVELPSADWIITGEGSFDRQSLRGKVVCGIAAMASQLHTRIAVLAGQVSIPPQEYHKLGIETVIPCKPDDMPLDYALKNCRTLLDAAARRLVKECFCS